MEYTQKKLKEMIDAKLSHHFGLRPDEAEDEHIYKALALITRDILLEKRADFSRRVAEAGGKRVYYLSIEFLMGRSLRNNLYNLGMMKNIEKILPMYYNTTLESISNCEQDAGLGNGGLGRLAACYLDSMATCEYLGMGYSLLYEFGIFSQRIIDGYQVELPDYWLPGGQVWLVEHQEDTVPVSFGGTVEEHWEPDPVNPEKTHHWVETKDCTTVYAVPHDMMCAGLDGKGVSTLRLWDAKAAEFDLVGFNDDGNSAIDKKQEAEKLTKVLYPNDNHTEGKSLRLSQQYFLVSATLQDIMKRHLRRHRTMNDFAESVAIQINDTHPALAVPELMRILVDECGFEWDDAWKITTKSLAYTNHTVLPEALECWDEKLFRERLPRIYQIICEINRRFCAEVKEKTGGDENKVKRMSIVLGGAIRMANLCCAACHKVNGVSELHSNILKESLFADFYSVMPEKFTNVTNGIAHRRWLGQANPGLTSMITDLIGDKFLRDASQLEKLLKYKDDPSVLKRLEEIKKQNKERLAKYVYKTTGVKVDTSSIFDVQVKRLHEYKRQLLNGLNIFTEYQWLLENPDADYTPKTYFFGAKAAASYTTALTIIRFLCKLADQINNDPRVNGKLKVLFLENYRVTLAELLIPASEVSEQISLAGYEASGTSNMKFMLNGAITLGTEDGANVEIHRAVGDDNIVIFGMRSDEVKSIRRSYDPHIPYNNNQALHRAVDALEQGVGGVAFPELKRLLLERDTYMCLADFDEYAKAQKRMTELYNDRDRFNRMSLINIANAGIFSSDRAIEEYAHNIWGLA